MRRLVRRIPGWIRLKLPVVFYSPFRVLSGLAVAFKAPLGGRDTIAMIALGLAVFKAATGTLAIARQYFLKRRRRGLRRALLSAGMSLNPGDY